MDHPSLSHCTIISAGLGEDASFDVEFAERYHSTVILVDPTPRAIKHYEQLIARLGQPGLVPYSSGGRQDPAAYSLQHASLSSFTLVRKALWNAESTVRLYEPPNPTHVSHSISDFQNGGAMTGRYIEVLSTTARRLVDLHRLSTVALVKLDIEGAEIEVIRDMLSTQVIPSQLLVEFDELTVPTDEALEKFLACDADLRSAGYSCIHWNGAASFSYAHDRLFTERAKIAIGSTASA